MSRKEDNFISLMKDNNVIIPIIQRDYAQGRDDGKDGKANKVRERLIEDWIREFNKSDNSGRVDFNFIYGYKYNEKERNYFLPVDGQQRLTSSFLLYWYLAYFVGRNDIIKQWNFDYKTRNSASEFFAFLIKNDEAKSLYEILEDEQLDYDKKQIAIKNKSWFKSKWENDPTVVSCVNFLCLMSDKMKEADKRKYWEKLNGESPAIYFTIIDESIGTDANRTELNAAKSYARMNARGKKLTDFENIMAIIDEIEEPLYERDDDDYCHKKLKETISWKYDSDYIDVYYKYYKKNNNDLYDITKKINDECLLWFNTIYKIYKLFIENNDEYEYEKEIYELSQKRYKDPSIKKYLYMVKAVFEVLCNSNNNNELAYEFKGLKDNLTDDRWIIAFTLYCFYFWEKDNNDKDNFSLLVYWNRFKDMLNDFCFSGWNYSSIVTSLKKLLDRVKKIGNGSVDKYFIKEDFEKNSLCEIVNLEDLKCRIVEQKIKSKLLYDKDISLEDYKKLYSISVFCNRRFGFLYYICGYTDIWDLGDWTNKSFNKNNPIKEYIDYIGENKALQNMIISNSYYYADEGFKKAIAIYAYAAFYDYSTNALSVPNIINGKPDDEIVKHIWNPRDLDWNDDIFDNLSKINKLDTFKHMFELLKDFKRKNTVDNSELITKYKDKIDKEFDNNSLYADCWLRVAIQHCEVGNVLSSKLKNNYGVVVDCNTQIPVILLIYLLNNQYDYKDINKLDESDKKFSFYYDEEKKEKIIMLLHEIKERLSFTPENKDYYKHSKYVGNEWDLTDETWINTRNLNLCFDEYIDLSKCGIDIKNKVISVDNTYDGYKLKMYELYNTDKLKKNIIIREIVLNTCFVDEESERIIKEFKKVKNNPQSTNDYDHWLEIQNNKYDDAFERFLDWEKCAVADNKKIRKKVWKKIHKYENRPVTIRVVSI